MKFNVVTRPNDWTIGLGVEVSIYESVYEHDINIYIRILCFTFVFSWH